MKPRKKPSPFALDALLTKDPFRFTRTDADLRRLERARRRAGATPHTDLVRALLGTSDSFGEAGARQLWNDIVAHRKMLSARVGRPIPLRAAALDWLYLRDEEERPIRPMLVSQQTLSDVVEEGRRDPLTGLLRKANFEKELASALEASPTVGGSVVLIDLDGFKEANDRLGHTAGDGVLRRFAEVARSALRRSDLVGRVGGDEFALALLELETETARTIVERLRGEFETRCAPEGVSFSFGIARPRRSDTPGTLIARADAAMYRQKRQRRGARARASGSRSRAPR